MIQILLYIFLIPLVLAWHCLVLMWKFFKFCILKIIDFIDEKKPEKKGSATSGSGLTINTAALLNEIKARPKEINNKVFNTFTENKFYNEKELINSKYEELKTPNYILNQLKGNYNSFVNDSLKYRNHYKNNAVFCPLNTYYPAFSSLNTYQLNWYLYWRKEFLSNNIVKTDLSYIFMFAYELINYSFNSSSSFNISILEKLYNSYKNDFPQLDNYLPNWLMDMLSEVGYYDNQEPDIVKEPLITRIEELDSIDKISIRDWRIFFDETRTFTNKEKVNLFRLGQQKFNSRFRKTMTYLVLYYDENKIDIIKEWFELKEIKENKKPYIGAIGNIYDRPMVTIKYKKYIATTEAISIVSSVSRLCFDMLMFPPNQSEEEYIMNKANNGDYKLPLDFIQSLYLTKTKKTSKDKQKKQEEVIPSYDDVEVTTTSRNLEDTATIKMPDGRVIKINGMAPDETQSSTNNTEAVVKENNPKEEFSVDLDIVKEKDNEIKIVSIESKIEFDYVDKDFIDLFKNNVVAKNEAKTYCIKKGKMINAYINELNKKYFSQCGSELITEDDENYILSNGGAK